MFEPCLLFFRGGSWVSCGKLALEFSLIFFFNLFPMFLRNQMKGWYLAIVAPLIAKFHRVICSWEILCFFPLFFLLYSVLVQYVGLISFFLDGTIVSFFFCLCMVVLYLDAG